MKKQRMKIAKSIAAARQQRGMSQGELAKAAGMQPSAIGHFETARRMPSCENLIRLADALQVSMDQLVGRGDDAKGSRLATAMLHMSLKDRDALTQFAEIMAYGAKDRR